MYYSSQLRWVKNVKRAGGTAWAYNEFNVGDIFFLNFPKQFKGNVLKANVGELILLFQTINNPKGTYLTHIVVPIDNHMVIDEASTHPYTRLVGVVAKADPIHSLPKPISLSFTQPNRGACCHLNTIKEIGTGADINDTVLQNTFWDLFINKNAALDQDFELITTGSIDDEQVEEGTPKERYKVHKYFERNSAIVKRKKQLAAENNTLICEICKFNFSEKYPQVGVGFIECHHKTFLSTGQIRVTSLDDLALVCSNCHRMLHRTLDGNFLTVEQLRNIYNS